MLLCRYAPRQGLRRRLLTVALAGASALGGGALSPPSAWGEAAPLVVAATTKEAGKGGAAAAGTGAGAAAKEGAAKEGAAKEQAPVKAGPAADRPAPAPREYSAEELEPAPRVPMVVFAYDVPGAEPEVATRLEAALGAALRPDRRLALVDARDSLDPAEPGLVALSKVQEQLEQARTLIETKRAPQAEKLLEQAMGTLLRELGHVGTPEGVADTLRETLGLQASVAFVGGDRAKAIGLLQAVYNVDRRLRWVSRLFPESMKDFIEEVRPQIVNAARGGLVLGSTPGGAQILIGGKKVGQGRATVDALPPGAHYVTWLRRNRRALTSRVVVQAGQTTELSPPLPRYGTDDPVSRMEGVEGQLGKGEMPMALSEAAALLRADLVVLVKAQAPDKGALRLSAYLYDRRQRKLLKEAHGSAAPDAPEREAPKLAAALLQDVHLDGQLQLQLQAEQDREKQKPKAQVLSGPMTGLERVTQSRWFWPVIGVAAGALVGVAVVEAAVHR